jgi:5,6-dimethylbenzimidazole synthase
MSGANAQPWEFVVVRDPDTRQKIVDSWLEPHREVYTIEQTRIPELRLRPLRDDFDTAPPWQEAPALIMVLGDRRTYQATVLAAHFLSGEGGTDATYLKNMANATQLLHLAAAAQGLGSMWLSVARVWGQAIKQILDIPEMLGPAHHRGRGLPGLYPQGAYRRRLADIVHYDKYDRSKYRSAEQIQQFLYSLRGYTEGAYKQGFLKDSFKGLPLAKGVPACGRNLEGFLRQSEKGKHVDISSFLELVKTRRSIRASARPGAR